MLSGESVSNTFQPFSNNIFVRGDYSAMVMTWEVFCICDLIIGCLHVFHSYMLEDWFKFGYAGSLGRLDHVYASNSICYGFHSY